MLAGAAPLDPTAVGLGTLTGGIGALTVVEAGFDDVWPALRVADTDADTSAAIAAELTVVVECCGPTLPAAA